MHHHQKNRMPQPELIQKRLRDEGDKLLALFDGLTPEQWQTVVYIDSMTWTIKDVLAHQIAAEREFQFYGRDVLNGGRGAPEGFVINEFNNRSVAAQADRTAAQLIEDFRSVRKDSIEFVALIRADQFAWEGLASVLRQDDAGRFVQVDLSAQHDARARHPACAGQ